MHALELIGNTPLVEIRRLNPNKKVNIYAKLEGFNPSGSIKDRIALKMIEQAEKNKELTKDKTIIEATSGNTGIGIAMVAAIKGYKVKIVMSENVSVERRKIMNAYGAEVVLTPAKEGTDGAIRKAEQLVKENPEKYFMPNQFKNKYNVLAHYENTAKEIFNQMPDVDVFVASIGTSGTLMGISSFLKKWKPIEVIAAEPTLGHKIQGLKNMKEAIVPEIYDKKKIDTCITVEDEDAFETTRRLAKEEGLFVGMSSGAALWAALEKAKTMESGNIVVIFPDKGDRYLSTDLF
ncbi:cysteine synthase A [Candidatus Woesearchaeota archaeon]|nr:cysteine synthase A [Candidatus Woesearchaeota archaeon]